MVTNGGYEVTSGDLIYIALMDDTGQYVPFIYKMESNICEGKCWFLKEENCQKYCTELNNY